MSSKLKLPKIERQVVFKVAGQEFSSATDAKNFLVEKAALDQTRAAVERVLPKTHLEGYTGTADALAQFVNLVNGVLKGKAKPKAPAAAKPAVAPKAPAAPAAPKPVVVKKTVSPKAPAQAKPGVKTRAKAGVSMPPPPAFPGN